MNNLIKLSFFFFLFSCVENVDYTNNIKNDVMYLSDDKLEGRKTGTDGEKLAAKFISERFYELCNRNLA